MPGPLTRHGRPIHPPEPKAWESHDKSPNGYIVRFLLDNGYETYRPEFTSYIRQKGGGYTPHLVSGRALRWTYNSRPVECELQQHKRIELPENYTSRYDYYRPSWETYCKRKQELAMPYSCPASDRKGRKVTDENRSDGRTRGIGNRLVTDDPVEDGSQLAKSEVLLPSDRVVATTAVRVVNTVEAKELADLQRQGLLRMDEYSELNSITHEEPTYSLRVVQDKRRSRRKQAKSATVSKNAVVGIDNDGWQRWDHLSQVDNEDCFSIIDKDDLISVAESWVELEAEEASV